MPYTISSKSSPNSTCDTLLSSIFTPLKASVPLSLRSKNLIRGTMRSLDPGTIHTFMPMLSSCLLSPPVRPAFQQLQNYAHIRQRWFGHYQVNARKRVPHLPSDLGKGTTMGEDDGGHVCGGGNRDYNGRSHVRDGRWRVRGRGMQIGRSGSRDYMCRKQQTGLAARV